MNMWMVPRLSSHNVAVLNHMQSRTIVHPSKNIQCLHKIVVVHHLCRSPSAFIPVVCTIIAVVLTYGNSAMLCGLYSNYPGAGWAYCMNGQSELLNPMHRSGSKKCWCSPIPNFKAGWHYRRSIITQANWFNLSGYYQFTMRDYRIAPDNLPPQFPGSRESLRI